MVQFLAMSLSLKQTGCMGRLGMERHQGDEMTLPVWDNTKAQEIIESLASEPGALLPILHALQERFGWICEDAVPSIAEALNWSRAEVHGVLTFYHDFRRGPPGRHVLKLCQAEACQARGGREVTQRAQQRLGIELGETTADGAMTFEPIYCLGLCASGPVALIDGAPVARLTPERIECLITKALT